jgi:hypothetical protein
VKEAINEELIRGVVPNNDMHVKGSVVVPKGYDAAYEFDFVRDSFGSEPHYVDVILIILASAWKYISYSAFALQ